MITTTFGAPDEVESLVGQILSLAAAQGLQITRGSLRSRRGVTTGGHAWRTNYMIVVSRGGGQAVEASGRREFLGPGQAAFWPKGEVFAFEATAEETTALTLDGDDLTPDLVQRVVAPPQMPTRVAFLGLGIMGSRMAANVARAGFELTVWNRTASKAQAFAAEHGGAVAGTSAEAAAGADLVITMVVDGPQVEAVLLGPEGVVDGARPGLLCVDSSTIGPAATLEIAAALGERDIHLLDAPVTGSSPRAQDGTLTIMAGGSPEDFDRARPVLEAMGSLIVHAGPLGHGQMVKLINNSVAAINTTVAGEALLVAKRAGLDLDALVEVMAAGSGGSAMLQLKSGPMRSHDYTTLFKLEHMLKDVRLCLEEGQAAGAPFPTAAYAREILTAAAGRGHGQDDFAALIEVLEGAAGIKLNG